MLKTKKRSFGYLILIISLVAFALIISGFSNKDASKKDSNKQEEKGKVVLKYTAPDMDWDSASKKQKEELKEIGWELEDGVPVQYRDVTEEIDEAIQEGYMEPDEELENASEHDEALDEDEKDTFIVNGEETKIEDGEFEVSGNPEEIEVETGEGIEQKVEKDEDGEYQVILEQDFTELMGEMEDHEGHDGHEDDIQTMDYGDTYSPGDWVHCNRFNGPKTNDKHLKKTSIQGAINFWHSDCDYGALKYCKSHSNCNQKEIAAYCSKKQGHSTKYHRH